MPKSSRVLGNVRLAAADAYGKTVYGEHLHKMAAGTFVKSRDATNE